MGSIIFSDEEARYVKAMLRWDPDEKRRLAAEAEARRKKPAGEFRVLVVGAKGTGKTSILTRFAKGTFRGEGELPDPSYERGCRRTVGIDGQAFTVDALELASKHVPDGDNDTTMLGQALNITEGAVLVYDIRDPASFESARRIADFIRGGVGDRGYALMLVGNKSDADDERRGVPWALGSKTAASFRLPGNISSSVSPSCAFVEVSAKTGDNVAEIFPAVGREVLRLRRVNRQRLEQAERSAQLGRGPSQASPLRRKMSLWKSLTTPFFRR